MQGNPEVIACFKELLRGELAAAGVPTEGYTVIDMWEVVR